MNLNYIQKRISHARCSVMFDIDETILLCLEKWQQYIKSEMGINITLQEIINAGSVDNVFSSTPIYPEFVKIAEKLRASDEFNSGQPVIEGSLDAFKKLKNNSGLVMGAYITARPTNVINATKADLVKNGFPPLPILARPNGIDHQSSIDWKLNILAQLNVAFNGVLIMVDDNLELAKALRERNSKDQKYIVTILYKGPLTSNLIKRDNITTCEAEHFYIADWVDIPVICSRYC